MSVQFYENEILMATDKSEKKLKINFISHLA